MDKRGQVRLFLFGLCAFKFLYISEVVGTLAIVTLKKKGH